MDFLSLFALPVVVGVCVGVLSGLLGIGGGTILVPIFRLLFGMTAIGSTATSLFTIIPTSLSGAVSHARNKTCLPKLGIALGLGGALTSPVGVWLSSISPAWCIMAAAALIIGYSAINMFKKALRVPKASGSSVLRTEEQSDAAASPRTQSCRADEGLRTEVRGASASTPISGTGGTLADFGGPASSGTAGSPDAASCGSKPSSRAEARFVGLSPQSAAPGEPSLTDVDQGDGESTADIAGTSFLKPPALSRKQLLQGLCIGLVAGLASGYVGVGGGFIMVPLMLSVIGIPMTLASGTSLIGVMLLAIPGTIEQGLMGNIDFMAGIAVALGSIPGAMLGAKLVRKVPERTLRLLFGSFLLIAAVVLVLNELGILG